MKTSCMKTARETLLKRVDRRTTTVRAVSQHQEGAKRVLITGGNTGIGFQTAKALAAKGYHVDIACRDAAKALTALVQIRKELPECQVGVVNLDLADLSTVRDASKLILDKGVPYDVLINNAGVMATPQLATKDGFEYQLGVNHLGHFVLTNMLLPLLKQNSRPVRIINVSSTAHMVGKINFDDLMCASNYQPWAAYGQSKLANVMFTYELARRLPANGSITTNCLHPGVVRTELARYMMQPDAWYTPLLQAALVPFTKSPEQGAETSIYLASSPEVEGVTAKYFDNCKPTASSFASYDAKVAQKLWEVSAELTKLQVDAPVAVSALR